MTAAASTRTSLILSTGRSHFPAAELKLAPKTTFGSAALDSGSGRGAVTQGWHAERPSCGLCCRCIHSAHRLASIGKIKPHLVS